MRRPLAALMLGAVSLAGLVPAAGADAAELPKLPFFHRKPALKLGCKVVRQDAAGYPPAVACRWSSPRPAPADAAGIAFELRRGGGGAARTAVYTGPQTWFVDTSVEPGGRYLYRAEVVRPDTRRKIHSRVVVVRVPPVDDRGPIDPVPVPTPKPRPVDPTVKPVPAPEPKPAPVPVPKPAPEPAPKPRLLPEPKPGPIPEPRPEPLPAPLPKPMPEPEPRPAPEPAPKPTPVVARMKLACAPQRVATTDTTDGTTTKDSATNAPTGPVVVCQWAAPSDLKVAGYQLWRAERPDGTKQVVFRSVDATRYVDRAVSSGHSYLYVVRALDADGRVIGQSDAVTVAFHA